MAMVLASSHTCASAVQPLVYPSKATHYKPDAFMFSNKNISSKFCGIGLTEQTWECIEILRKLSKN